MNNRLFAVVCACALAGNLAGCSLVQDAIYGGASSATNSAANTAGQNVGNEVGNRAGNAAVNSMGGPTQPNAAGPNLSALNAQLTVFYTQFIFSMAFSSGGYAVGSTLFKPGEYVRYNAVSERTSNATIERAYLGDDAEGNQWWKVKFVNPDKNNDTVIMEALLSPKDQKLVRLRGQFPGDQGPKEMPVTENTGYVPPTKLTKQSIEGATVGTESVSVPAGTFGAARHVVFGGMGGNHEWWLDDKVPGGVVKQSTSASGSGRAHTLELVAYGGGAGSELGTKLK
jgi:hypothetical protein